MSEFLTINEFMSFDEEIRSLTGKAWLCYYELAKASYLKFGIDGPPIDSNVIVYFNGAGGNGFDRRKFIGSRDSVYFNLKSEFGHESSTFIYEKINWWKYFVPYELIECDFNPNWLRKKIRYNHIENLAHVIHVGY